MSDIRFNQWLHNSGTGGVSQVDGGHVGIGTTNPLIPVGSGNTSILNVGVVTSNSYYGDGSNLSNITSTTINNNANNRVITGSGTANTLEAEANLTYDGTTLKIGGDSGVSGTWGLEVYNTDTSNNLGKAVFAGNQGAEIKLQDTVSGEIVRIAANGQASFYSEKAGDPMVFYTKPSGGSNTERLRIESGGSVGISSAIHHIGDTNTNFGFPSNDSYRLRVAGSTRLYTSSTEPIWHRRDVSAGVSTQTMLLNYNNAGGSGVALAFAPSTNYDSRHSSIEVVNDDGNNNMSMRFKVTDASQNAHAVERMRIQTNGRVNIGVNPNVGAQALLNLKGDGNDGNQTVLLRLGNDSSGSGTGAAIVMGAGAGASSQGATIAGFYDGTGTSFTVGTNASFNGSTTERLRISNTGMITLGTPTNTTLKAEICNAVNGHYFASQCDDNSNGFEIYQLHGATHSRASFAVYDNKTGSKDLSFKIDGAGWTYHNTTSNGTTNGNVDKRYNWGSTNNLNFGMHCTTRHRYSIWEHRQIGRSQPRTAQMSCGENGSNQGQVYIYSSTANADVTGGVNISNGATSWSSNSDMRLKNKTGDILNALEDINKIEPIRFTWKYGPDNNPHVGVSAQSVENVVPEAIERSVDVERKREGDETEYMQVRYTELIPLSIAAIKELITKVETLEQDNIALRARVTNLEGN